MKIFQNISYIGVCRVHLYVFSLRFLELENLEHIINKCKEPVKEGFFVKSSAH